MIKCRCGKCSSCINRRKYAEDKDYKLRKLENSHKRNQAIQLREKYLSSLPVDELIREVENGC